MKKKEMANQFLKNDAKSRFLADTYGSEKVERIGEKIFRSGFVANRYENFIPSEKAISLTLGIW